MCARSLQTRRHVDAVTLFEGHDRALDLRLLADRALEGLDLALADEGVDALDLDVEQLLDRFLDLRLGRVLATLNITWLCSEAIVAFSVMTGEMITS